MRKCSLLVLIVILIGFSLPVAAQRFTASIRGTVTDETGAVLPGATVNVEGTETGLSRSTFSNEAGNYSFGDLPVGKYKISVELDGFKSAIVENIGLNVADVRRVNVKMELGAITEEITTTSSTLSVETVGGEVAGLVSGEEIRELPLNGRNFVQLTQLMPGVSAPDGLNFKNKGLLSGVDMSVSGSSVTGNNWTVDGASNNDYGSNRTILITPSVDSIEEFKIHRNSYGPEFGGAGGAQINLVTRGGSNDLQGSVYAFYRNDSLNESNFFLEQAGQAKEEIDRKDYGFTFGGPVLKDKLHFFVSQEWNDETRGTVRSAFVPTAAERAGDFSASDPDCGFSAPIDPLTGEPFPGNVIPADRLSAGGLALLNLYPTPNTAFGVAGCNNWIASVPTAIDWAQTNARLDWSANDSTRVLLRYTEDSWENSAPNAGGANGLWGDDPFPAVDSGWDQPGDSLVAQLNQVIGSSAINTFTFSMSGNEIDISRGPEGDALNQSINNAIPSFFPADGKTTGSGRSHPVYWGGATGTDLWNIAPWSNQQDLLNFKDDYEQVFGNHFVKAGILYADNSKDEACCGASAFETPHFWGAAGIGSWGATSGNRIADILIVDMLHGFDETEFQPAPDLEWQDIEAYIGDSWQIRSNLTIDLGVRYSRYKDPEAVGGNLVAFYPSLFDPALGNEPCNGLAQVPGTNPCGDAGLLGGGTGVSASFVRSDTNNFAPRFGMAWDVFGSGESVVRAGFGQFYQRERVNIQLDFGGQPPFTANTSGIRPLDEPGGQFLGAGFGRPNRGINPDNVTPYNFQFNLTWEQRLGLNTTFEVSYVGSRGRHLMRKADINQIASGDINGNGVDDRLEFVQSGGTGVGDVRPFFTVPDGRVLYWQTDGSSEYNGLQTQFVTRFGRGSQFQASYTFSSTKADDSLVSSSAGEENNQVTDFQNPGLDWGNAGLHRDHVFNSSLVWNLPTLEGKGGFMQHVLGNWTVSSIVQYSSGTPITVFIGSVPGFGNGEVSGTGFGGNQRPIRLDDVPCRGSGGTQIINPAAYTLEGLRLGDTSQGARRGDCEGPDFFQVDLSFYKTFRLTNWLDAQFRFEIFNLFNRDNFIGASVNSVINPFNVTVDGADLASSTMITGADFPGNFGQATAVRDPRQIQVGLKLLFR